MKKLLMFLFIAAIFSFSCGQKQNQQAVTKANFPILINQIDENEMMEKVAGMKAEMENYVPDSSAMEFLKNFAEDVNITVVLGTWCPDSRREVPRFMKIMKEANNSHFHCQYFGLDRSKADSLGTAEKFQVEYVPTFIVQMNGEEIGRIIETPTETIEQDLVEILKNASES